MIRTSSDMLLCESNSKVVRNNKNDFFGVNFFRHNVEKWSNIKNTPRFLKYVWPVFKIMHERNEFISVNIFFAELISLDSLRRFEGTSSLRPTQV